MHLSFRLLSIFAVAFTISIAAAAPPAPLDRTLAQENEAKQVQTAPVIDDMAFLRRVTVDLIGRIPTTTEIDQYLAWPASQRRAKAVDALLAHQRFPDRWTTFFADMLRIRSNATGGAEFLAFVHNAVENDMPYDRMVFRMIAASGKSGKTPEVGFILGDDADPMELAGATAQTFLGIRIACAQCHDHPFDMWTQEEFYEFAAFFGKTRQVENRFTRSVYTTEGDRQQIMWPPAEPGVTDRTPVKPAFLYDNDPAKLEPFVQRLRELRKKQALAKANDRAAGPGASVDDLLADIDSKVTDIPKKKEAFDVAAQAKKDIKQIDIEADLYRASELRHALATTITDPYNRYFSWSIANRMWKELVGRGFVEPVDDFRFDNTPSHPKTLDHLANEFVASGFDLKSLMRMIVLSDAYQRGHMAGADEAARQAAEAAFTATPMRRMIAEAMFDSVVTAGHLFDAKYPDGANKRTIRQMVRVRVDTGEVQRPAPVAPPTPGDGDEPRMAMAQPGMRMMGQPSGYDLEQSIEVDFDKVLAEAMKKEDAPEVAMIEAKSKEEIEAERIAMAAQQERQQSRARFVTKYVDVEVTYNPQFDSAYRMASPAPRPHFLRVFGQPGREELGDFRDELPSMRQALMMLNGSLTHEASRVGPYEPMGKLLESGKPNLDEAIRLAYREILTRNPSADEVSFAKQVIADAASIKEGVADLRWALFNCNEFRYLP